MTYRYIDVACEGHVTTITISRPEAHNALNAEAQYELERAFNAFAADDDQWIGIITAAGEKAFCAGLDLKEQAEFGGLVTPPTGFGGLTARFDCAKPVIAAVNGIAMGGGFELALACDIILASKNAVFALPEPRVGLAAMAGGVHRLPLIVGLTRAMGILLTGRRIDAAEALELGIVNEVVDGPVTIAAQRWAALLLECSPSSLRATKQAVHAALSQSFATAIREQWELPELKAMLASQDAVEGPRAFSERRTPIWTGR